MRLNNKAKIKAKRPKDPKEVEVQPQCDVVWKTTWQSFSLAWSRFSWSAMCPVYFWAYMRLGSPIKPFLVQKLDSVHFRFGQQSWTSSATWFWSSIVQSIAWSTVWWVHGFVRPLCNALKSGDASNPKSKVSLRLLYLKCSETIKKPFLCMYNLNPHNPSAHLVQLLLTIQVYHWRYLMMMRRIRIFREENPFWRMESSKMEQKLLLCNWILLKKFVKVCSHSS